MSDALRTVRSPTQKEPTPMKTLADVFEHTLQDVYFAEHAITKALPKVIRAVSQGA